MVEPNAHDHVRTRRDGCGVQRNRELLRGGKQPRLLGRGTVEPPHRRRLRGLARAPVRTGSPRRRHEPDRIPGIRRKRGSPGNRGRPRNELHGLCASRWSDARGSRHPDVPSADIPGSAKLDQHDAPEHRAPAAGSRRDVRIHRCGQLIRHGPPGRHWRPGLRLRFRDRGDRSERRRELEWPVRVCV